MGMSINKKVRTEARILEGEAGKMICKEADRLKPAAVVMGNGGRTLIQRLIISLFICVSLSTLI